MDTHRARPDTVEKATPFRLAALLVSFACLIVAITTFAAGLVDHFAIEHASEEARLRLEQLSWQMRDSLDRTLEQATRDASAVGLAGHPRQRDPDAARDILENLQRNYPDYAWIGIAKPDGKVFAATGGLLENRDVTRPPWFHTGQQSVIAEDYHPALLLGKLLPRPTDPWRFVDIAGADPRRRRQPARRAGDPPELELGAHAGARAADAGAARISAPKSSSCAAMASSCSARPTWSSKRISTDSLRLARRAGRAPSRNAGPTATPT